MHRRLAHPYAILTLVALIWAANAVAGKLAVGHCSPMMLTLLRWIVAVALLAPFALPRVRRDWPVIRPRLPFLLALGAVGFTLFNALFYIALSHTSTINVVIEQASMPLFVFVASFVLFRTPATRFQVLGFAVTLLGVALTASHGDLESLAGLSFNRGDALMMLAVLLYAAFTVGVRSKPAIHWLSFLFILSFAAFAAALPLAAIEAALGAAMLPDGRGVAIVVFSAVLPSILSQALYIKGIEMIGANRANLFVNLTPVFGAGLAVLVVGERPFRYHAVALTLVLAGLMLAERGAARSAAAA